MCSLLARANLWRLDDALAVDFAEGENTTVGGPGDGVGAGFVVAGHGRVGLAVAAESHHHEVAEIGAIGFGLVGRIHARNFHALPDARVVAEHLVEADLRGVHSHGVIRVEQYAAVLAFLETWDEAMESGTGDA